MTTEPQQCEQLQPWLAAYALGEADDDATARAHLAACPSCQNDLQAYRRVASLLPYSAAEVTPPSELRERVIAAVDAAANAHGAEAPAQRTPAPGPQRRRLSFTRAGWATAAFAALSIALLVWNLALQREIGGQAAQIAAQTTQIAASRQGWQSMIVLLNDESLHWYPIAGTQARGHFWATPQSAQACLVAQQLPALAPGQVYQVWLAHDGAPSSAGMFEAHDGNAWIIVQSDEPITTYRQVFVTAEPTGGSAAPTGPHVLDGRLDNPKTASAADRLELAQLLHE